MLNNEQRDALRDILILNPNGLYCSAWSNEYLADIFYLLNDYGIKSGLYILKGKMYQIKKSNGEQGSQCAEPASYSLFRVNAEEI